MIMIKNLFLIGAGGFIGSVARYLVLLPNGQYASLFVYTGLSLVLGFTAVFFGYASTNIL
jgi:fluoride ion exporter CrcB/FEX